MMLHCTPHVCTINSEGKSGEKQEQDICYFFLQVHITQMCYQLNSSKDLGWISWNVLRQTSYCASATKAKQRTEEHLRGV